MFAMQRSLIYSRCYNIKCSRIQFKRLAAHCDFCTTVSYLNETYYESFLRKRLGNPSIPGVRHSTNLIKSKWKPDVHSNKFWVALDQDSTVGKMISIIAVISLLAHFGQVEPCNTNSIPTFVPGKCPKVTVIPEFNVTRYLGDWFAQRQTTSSFQPPGQVSELIFQWYTYIHWRSLIGQWSVL